MKTTTKPVTIDIRKLIYGLLFGFLVMIILIFVGDIHKIGNRFLAFRWQLIPFIFLLTLFNYALRFVKWHYYLHVIGVRQISIANSLRIFVSGFPLAVTPGKVGEVLKGVWLEKQTGLPVSKGVSVVLAERISDGIAVLLLSTFGVFAYPRYWGAFIGVFTLLVGIIILSQIRPAALWIIRQLESVPFINRYVSHLAEFYEGSFLLFNPKSTLIAVSLGTVSWFGEGIGMYLILVGLGVPNTLATFSIAVFVLSFSTIVGAVSTLPGGLGAADASIAGMLVLLLGLPPDTASAATLLIRFATLWFGVSLGLAVWFFSPALIGLKSDSATADDRKRKREELS